MAKDTTTETTVDESTDTTAATTVDAAAASHTQAEKQGEVAIDKGAEADVVGRTSPEEDAKNRAKEIESAKMDAMRNHQLEHADDEHLV